MEANNVERMRKVLMRFYEWAVLDLNENAWCGDASGNYKKLLDAMAEEISHVLTLPLRNCDVGTAEKQSARFKHYCAKRRKDEVRCIGCQVLLEPLFEPPCEFIWMQMPYEAQEGGKE